MSDDNKPQETVVEIDSDELMSAMDEGIVEVSPHLAEEEDENESTPADDAGTAAGEPESEGAPDTNEADEGSATDEDDADENADDADGDEAADGDDPPDTDGEDEGGEGDGDEAGADESGVQPDHINDPIPETTNEKTAERIKGLIEIAKEQTARAEQGEEIVAAITQTGADPEQYTNTLTFLSLYNSTDPATRRQALEVARGVVRELSVELGEGSAELLAGHEDLQARIEEGTLTEQDAVELATVREQKKLQDARAEQASTKQTQKQTAEQAVESGKAALSAYGESMANDPTYVALYPTYVPLLRAALRHVHPEDYAAVAKDVYEELKSRVPATPAPATVPKKQPLRAKQSAGGGGGGPKKDESPKSALEAMDDALGGL